MAEITLEKIDIIKERTGVTYAEAKEALECSNGDVVEALVYLENKVKDKHSEKINEFYTTKDEFKVWLKDLVRKGNVTRIKIKNSKTDKVIVDVPVNAGIAAGMFALIWPPLLAVGILTAVVTKVTVEITKNDGSVEVVNTVIKNAVKDINVKMNDIKGELKEKVQNNEKREEEDNNYYEFTVKFDKNDVNDEEVNGEIDKKEDK